MSNNPELFFSHTFEQLNNNRKHDPIDVALVINTIQLPETITEGTEITIDADEIDLGNDQLIYVWHFGDGNVRAIPESP